LSCSLGSGSDETDRSIESLSAQECDAPMSSVQAAVGVASLSSTRRSHRCDDLVTKGLIARLFDCADDNAKKTREKICSVIFCLSGIFLLLLNVAALLTLTVSGGFVELES